MPLKSYKLDYFTDTDPERGSVTPIAEGVYWLRMSLPMSSLDHINLWLLEDGDGWAVVDTGVPTKETREIWKRVMAETFEGRPITRIFVTHMHPDHVGTVGYLHHKSGAPLYMSRAEYLLCRILAADAPPAPPEGVLFYERAGLTPEQIEIYKSRYGGFGKAIFPLPQSYHRLRDGDVYEIGGRDWVVVMGSGHSPEHACLMCDELGLFIAGDQLLPRITSNVSVWPTEPDGNPLADWLESCEKLREIIPDDMLVLPAHGIPFRGGPARLTRLIEGHETALERLWEFHKEPRQSWEGFPVMFKRQIDDGNRLMAVGETIAHLNYLMAEGRMQRVREAGEPDVYRAV